MIILLIEFLIAAWAVTGLVSYAVYCVKKKNIYASVAAAMLGVATAGLFFINAVLYFV